MFEKKIKAVTGKNNCFFCLEQHARCGKSSHPFQPEKESSLLSN
jgi:hypothetical protein